MHQEQYGQAFCVPCLQGMTTHKDLLIGSCVYLLLDVLPMQTAAVIARTRELWLLLLLLLRGVLLACFYLLQWPVFCSFLLTACLGFLVLVECCLSVSSFFLPSIISGFELSSVFPLFGCGPCCPCLCEGGCMLPLQFWEVAHNVG